MGISNVLADEPPCLQLFTALCCALSEGPSPASRHFFHKNVDRQEHIFLPVTAGEMTPLTSAVH